MEIKPAMVAIAAFVVITVIAAVLMPVLDDATAKTDTLTNEGYYRMSSIDDTDEGTITLVWDHTKPEFMTVNGTEIPIKYPNLSQTSISILFADNFTVRFFKQGSTLACQAYIYGGLFVGASVANGTDLTVTASAGSVTIANNAAEPVSKTVTYTTLYYPDVNGDWTMKMMDKTAYVFPDSTVIVANGLTSVGTRTIGLYFDGTIEDGYTFSNYSGTGTVSDVESVYTDSSKYVDLVELEKITFTLTNIDNVSGDVTYSYFLVPYQVTAERIVHLNDNENAILLVIPALLIIAIIIGILAYAIRMRE